MKRTWMVLAVVLFAVVFSVSLQAAKEDPKGSEGTKAGGFLWGDSLQFENNCTWTCSDGRTGGAEVNTEAQCAAACAGACGGTCSPAEEDASLF